MFAVPAKGNQLAATAPPGSATGSGSAKGSAPGTQLTGRHDGLIVTACGMAQVCVTLDYMALTVALPNMSHDLHVSPSSLQWALSAYLLAFASGLIVGGRLGDIYGRKRLLLIGLVIFGCASLLGGLAPSVSMLVAARTLQGVGAALFFPATLSIVRTSVSPDKVQLAIGRLVAISSLGIAAGPFLGGALTETLGWRWVFFINVPVAVIALLLSLRFVPESRDEGAVRSIDWPGLFSIALSVVCVTLVIDLGSQWGWVSSKTLALIAFTAVCITSFILIERKVKHPLIDLALFANRQFDAIAGVGAAANFMFAMSVLIFTLYFQEDRGLSPLLAGVLIVPFSIAGAASGPLAGRLVAKIGPRLPMAVGLLLTSGTFAAFWAGGRDLQWGLVVLLMAIMGLGIGSAYSTTNVATVTVVRPGFAGAASGTVVTGLVVAAAFAVTTTTELVEGISGGSSASVAAGDAIVKTIGIGSLIALVIGVLAFVLVPTNKSYQAAEHAASDASSDAPPTIKEPAS